jgi:hypothetical protein
MKARRAAGLSGVSEQKRLREAITVYNEDEEPNFTPEAIARIRRLKNDLDNGNFEEAFNQEFPPEETSTPDEQ